MATLVLGVAASAVVGATGATCLVASAITTAATLGGLLVDSYLRSSIYPFSLWICGDYRISEGISS